MLVNLSQRRAQMRAAHWTAQEAAPAGLKRLTLIRRPHGLEVRVQVSWWAWFTLGLWNLWMARRVRTALEAEELVELHVLRVRARTWPLGRWRHSGKRQKNE